jgi:hypothetical protein
MNKPQLFSEPIECKNEFHSEPVKLSAGITDYGSNKWIKMACDVAVESVKNNGGPFGAVLLHIDTATGSCAYINEAAYDRPGNPYGSEYEIFEAINESKPDFMIWLGDNMYLREPDWNSWTGITKRWTHSRSVPEMQPLLASAHHYAIWDDHDYGPNNSDRGWWNKNQTYEAFQLFWANPSYGIGDMKGGNYPIPMERCGFYSSG